MMRSGRPTKATGKVRAARLTDLAALGELSRIAQTDGSGSRATPESRASGTTPMM